jgi:hypothetical protein
LEAVAFVLQTTATEMVPQDFGDQYTSGRGGWKLKFLTGAEKFQVGKIGYSNSRRNGSSGKFGGSAAMRTKCEDSRMGV